MSEIETEAATVAPKKPSRRTALIGLATGVSLGKFLFVPATDETGDKARQLIEFWRASGYMPYPDPNHTEGVILIGNGMRGSYRPMLADDKPVYRRASQILAEERRLNGI